MSGSITLKDFVKVVEDEATVRWALKFRDKDRESYDKVYASFDSFSECINYLSSVERGTMTTDWILHEVETPKGESYYLWAPYFTFKIGGAYRTVRIDYICCTSTDDLKDSIKDLISKCEKAYLDCAYRETLSWSMGYWKGREEELENITKELKKLIK